MSDQVCRCGHGREWHDSCSKCYCPWFCPKDAPTEIAKAWRADRTARKASEEHS